MVAALSSQPWSPMIGEPEGLPHDLADGIKKLYQQMKVILYTRQGKKNAQK